MQVQTLQRALVRTVFPPRCLACGDHQVQDDFGLCGSCWGDVPFLSGLVCDSCGVPLPGESDRAEYCDECLQHPPPWNRGRAAMVYSGHARRLVLSLKHGDRQDVARPAGAWLGRVVRDILPADAVIVPVPLSRSRLRMRRYNQAALLAASLARILDRPWLPDALVRPDDTLPLEGISREDRFARLASAISVHPKRGVGLQGRSVLIVDDVMTSGATLAASTEAAFAAGAKEVCICVLARAVKDA